MERSGRGNNGIDAVFNDQGGCKQGSKGCDAGLGGRKLKTGPVRQRVQLQGNHAWLGNASGTNEDDCWARVLRQVTQDTRTRVASTKNYPNWAIGKLTMTNKKGVIVECSGAFISPLDFLTSAHCILNTTNNMYFLDGYVIPALQGGSQPYGRLEVESANLLQAYVSMPDWSLSAVYFDVAVVRTKNPSGAWLRMQGTLNYAKHCQSTTEMLRTCGYAQDIDNMSSQICVDCPKLTTKFCQDASANPSNIITAQTCFVNEGQSGSPLFVPSSGLVVGMLSGFGKFGEKGVVSWYTPLDNYQLDYLLNPKWKVTMWSLQGNLQPTNQPIRSSAAAGTPRLCLQAPTAAVAGAAAIVQPCAATAAQRWTRSGSGNEALKIKSSTTGYCLDVDAEGKKSGDKAILQPCSTDAGWRQLWFLDFKNRLRNGNAPNLCLSTSAASPSVPVLEACGPAAKQQWEL